MAMKRFCLKRQIETLDSVAKCFLTHIGGVGCKKTREANHRIGLSPADVHGEAAGSGKG